MTPIAVLLFMSGIISLMVGATRTYLALRTGSLSRPTLPAGAWVAMSLYGVVLASVGIVVAR